MNLTPSSDSKESYMKEFILLCDHLLEEYDQKTAKEHGDRVLGFKTFVHDGVPDMFAKYCVDYHLPDKKLVPYHNAILFTEIRGAVEAAIPMDEDKCIDMSSVNNETIHKLKTCVQKMFWAHCDPEDNRAS